MAKRSAAELFEYYYTALVYSLPIKDADFLNELFKNDLLPGDLKTKLESLTLRNERSSYFLDNMIKVGLAVGDSRCFTTLLTVMKSSKYDNVKDLAKSIDENLAVDIKIQRKIVIANVVYVRMYTYVCKCS